MVDYEGYKRLTDDEAAYFYEHHELKDEVLENEYVIINDQEVYCYQKGIYRRVDYPTIETTRCGSIKARNVEQRAAIDMLLNDTTTVKLLTGTWGTGKTMLLTNAAFKGVETNKFDGIVFVRNNVQVKDTDNMGALPGDQYEKFKPYIGPLADHVGGFDGIGMLIAAKKLEIAPLAYLRGRNIENKVVICTESENFTKEHLQLIISRAAEGTNIWFDADCRQRDRVTFEKSKGIEMMIERLKGNELFSCVHLVKSERSATAALADLLND